MVDFLIGADRDSVQAWCDQAGQFAYAQLAPSARSRLVDAADGPAAGALTLIRQLVEQEELHPA